MCDAAVCAAMSSGSPRLAIAALTELRAMLDSHSAGHPADGSLTSSMTMAKHRADRARTDRGHQFLETRALHQSRPGATEIVINHGDGGESIRARRIGQRVLTPLALPMLSNLPRGRLADVDNGAAVKVLRRDLGMHHMPRAWPVSHCFLPRASRSRSANACRWYAPWIHLVQYRLRDYFVFEKNVPNFGTLAFRLQKEIDCDLTWLNDLRSFDDQEISDVFQYSMSLVDSNVDRLNIAAANVMYFVLSERIEEARHTLEEIIRQGFRVEGNLKFCQGILAIDAEHRIKGSVRPSEIELVKMALEYAAAR
jgi:hypothetical protein